MDAQNRLVHNYTTSRVASLYQHLNCSKMNTLDSLIDDAKGAHKLRRSSLSLYKKHEGSRSFKATYSVASRASCRFKFLALRVFIKIAQRYSACKRRLLLFHPLTCSHHNRITELIQEKCTELLLTSDFAEIVLVELGMKSKSDYKCPSGALKS